MIMSSAGEAAGRLDPLLRPEYGRFSRVRGLADFGGLTFPRTRMEAV
jgi:hypothetical protein